MASSAICQGQGSRLYHDLPTLNQWKQDSHVSDPHPHLIEDRKVWRSSDPVLLRMDNLVRELQRPEDDGQRKYLLAELYFATNYWRRYSPEKHGGMHKDRTGAVDALFECTERKLAQAFGRDKTGLGEELANHYGCSLTAHGIYCDGTDVPHYFTERSKQERFKVFFDGGKANWHRWWQTDCQPTEEVDTKRAYESTVQKNKEGKGALEENWAYCVMSKYRDIYLAPHRTGGMFPKFHSTIEAGAEVQFAGSMLVEKGVIKAIKSDSGHYQPGKLFFLNILEHLHTVGMKLDDVKLYDYESKLITDNAEKYRRTRGTWSNVELRRDSIDAAKSEADPAKRGKVYWERLNTLKQQNDPKPLETLFQERWDKSDRHIPWKDAWQDVLGSIRKFDEKGTKGWEKTITEYLARPPAPPRPSTPHPSQDSKSAPPPPASKHEPPPPPKHAPPPPPSKSK